MGISLQFLGAVGTVTGSQFLVRTGSAAVLVDCGMFQGSPEEVSRNRIPFAFEAGERLRIGDVVAFAMGDADIDRLTLGIGARIGRVVALDGEVLALADEFQMGVAHEDAGQQPRLAGDLEAVADPQHIAAAGGVVAGRVHDMGAAGDGAGAQGEDVFFALEGGGVRGAEDGERGRGVEAAGFGDWFEDGADCARLRCWET